MLLGMLKQYAIVRMQSPAGTLSRGRTLSLVIVVVSWFVRMSALGPVYLPESRCPSY